MKTPAIFSFRSNSEEEASYKEVFDLYYHKVFVIVSRKIPGRDNVLDVVQNTFTHLWKHRKLLQNEEKKENIIFKTTQQEIALYYRKNKISSQEIDERNSEMEDVMNDDFENHLKRDQRIEQVFSLLEKIPERNRQIFLLNKIHNKSYKETAEIMNVSESVVANQVSKILNYIKNNITFILIFFLK